ncbi:MAG: phage holin family protein [Microcoleaceae cyanobacterium]
MSQDSPASLKTTALSLIPLLATVLSLFVVDILFPGVALANFPAALLAALVIGAVNWGIRPILAVLSFPITLVTLGAFSLVVNGFCFWLASVVVPGFRVGGLLSFLFGPVILSFVNTALTHYFADRFPQAQLEESAD